MPKNSTDHMCYKENEAVQYWGGVATTCIGHTQESHLEGNVRM